MNEDNFRNQVNVIYGAPCEVIAAGENRNLVQAAMLKRKQDEKTEIEQLERILSFGQPLDKIKKDNSKEVKDRRITQAAIPNCNEVQRLKKLLDMDKNL